MAQRTRSFPRSRNLGDALALRIEIQADGCWVWQSATTQKGYGTFKWRSTCKSVHRWVWLLTVGPVPEGLEFDHLCRVRACCNPDHLELVTHAENMARAKCRAGTDNHNGAKTHCPQGHEYAVHGRVHKGRRYCVPCNIATSRQWRAKRKANA